MGTIAVEARGNEAGVREGDAGECGAAAPGKLAGNEACAGECGAAAPGELAGDEAWAGECDAAAPGELAGDEACAGECDAAAPGELAGNEAGAGATAVDWPAGGRGVEPPGPPQAAGASFEEWGADVAERFMSLT